MPSDRNICPCPFPPGGSAVCEPYQLAICRVKDGLTQAECVNPPPGIQTRQEYENWVLAAVTGIPRLPSTQLSWQDQAILNAGRFSSEEVGEVTFRLPSEEPGPIATVEVPLERVG